MQAAKELGARHAWPNNSIWLVAVGWLRGGAKAGDNYEGHKYRSGAEWSAALMAVFHLLTYACDEPDQHFSAASLRYTTRVVPSNAWTERSADGGKGTTTTAPVSSHHRAANH